MNKLLIFSLLLAHSSFSLSTPYLSETDRTVRVPFSDQRATRVPAVVDSPVLVELPGNEEIDALVRGNPDQETWEIVKRGHRIFIRAMKDAKPIQLTAVTKSRAFIFDLSPVTATKDNFENRIARIVVDLPASPKPAIKPIAVPSPIPSVVEPAASPKVSSKRNREYSLQIVSESSDVRPREVFDDGRFTYFRFPNNLEIPVIYRSVPDSTEEWIVNSHREGDFIVMQAVSPMWTLRLAGNVLGIFNEAFDVEGVAPERGTTSQSIKREIRP
ncbi:TrbG/VirB9 family P-type conjugative transfer protein [Delftia sp. GW456-R20]|uniref:TrbG/VirB9 family P-type conjugative transfer protein n=1 Tax=Delftia sp. GW456-R20 TaxID=1827145 RepID=UPI0009EF464D|nr:TrbG/VirB9 family P-type conjugative transfer protein [Delftia sp. GW456-R20]